MWRPCAIIDRQVLALDEAIFPQGIWCRRSCLFDHLVGERHKILWQVDAGGFGGLEVDDELKVCRLLEWQFSRSGAAEDARGEHGVRS